MFLLPTGARPTSIADANPPTHLRNAMLPELVDLNALNQEDPLTVADPGDAGYGKAAYATTFFSRVEGPTPVWGGRTLFTLDASTEEQKSLALYLRGFYSFMSGGPHDASGTQLALAGRPADGVFGSLVLHHELREQEGNLLATSMLVKLREELYAIGSFAAGFSADFLPITWLEGEMRARARPRLRLGGGLGASFWQDSRRHIYLLGSAFYPLGRRLGVEQRLVAGAILAPGMRARLNAALSTSVVHGRHGKRLVEGRFSIGDGPLYRPGISETYRRDRLGVDLGGGFRSWLGPTYGYAINFDLGHQLGVFSRVGLDVALFVEL
jgi:hypothetical protein